MKRFLSIILLICICSTFCIPANVFASNVVASGECGTNLIWTLDNSGTLTIEGIGNMPWSHYSYGSSTAPWRNYGTDVKKVIIKNGVTNISNVAFEEFVNLTTVTIPNSVNVIGLYAFNKCSNLVDITIPDSVTSIGSGAFAECGKLVSVTIPNGVTNIGTNAFYKCSNLESIIIPNSVTSIDDAAFQQCSNLTNITIPNGVTSIGSNAFYKCNSLTSIVLPENVTNIRWSSFERCENLMNVTVFNTNATFGKDVFKNCSSSLVLQGYSGSTTEKYANENNIEFKKIDIEEVAPDNEICSICEDEIINYSEFYDDDGNIICELCSKNQNIELKCPHCSEIIEITEEEYDERDNIVCPDCMKYIVYEGEDTEFECFDCGETFYCSETKVVENGNIYCPYCDEIVDEENTDSKSECYICGEYFNTDDLLYDEDDDLICQECYDELQNEDEEVIHIECPNCWALCDEGDIIYDEDGNAICPYCDYYIYEDVVEELEEVNPIECFNCGETWGDLNNFSDFQGHIYCPYCNALIVIGYDEGFTTSDWAEDEVNEAYENELIPETLLDKDLTERVSRGEFAAVAVQLYEKMTESEAGIGKSPFTDISGDENQSAINSAWMLGITDGITNTTFEPDADITREQLATMLCRVLNKYDDPSWNIGDDIYYDITGVARYDDDMYISDWAKESVYYMTDLGIIEGVGDNCFAPRNVTSWQEAQGYATATREQAIIMALRMYNAQ